MYYMYCAVVTYQLCISFRRGPRPVHVVVIPICNTSPRRSRVPVSFKAHRKLETAVCYLLLDGSSFLTWNGSKDARISMSRMSFGVATC